jgi:MFS family permease
MRQISLAPSLSAHDTPAYLAVGAPRGARISVSLIFFANGFVVASWLPHIPAVKERLALGDFLLGTAFFSMAVGSVLVLPFAGWSAGRFGSNATTRAAALTLCVLLPAALWAPNLATLVLALLAFGAANGMLDVSMNAQAVLVEDRYRRPILSSLHGLYSTGGLAGASLAALAASIGISASAQALGLAIVLGPLLVAISRFLLRQEARRADPSPVLARPSRALMGLGALAFLALMAEGAVGDWAAVFLREYGSTGMDGAAIGFAGFSLAMAAGRFGGDWVRGRWGAPILLRAGGLIAVVGMAIALTAPGLVLSVLGFTLFGLGLANMIPILFGAAGRARGMAPGLGIAAVATTGYAGLLAGPPLIGITAEFAGLRFALMTIICGVLAIAVFAEIVRSSPDEGKPLCRSSFASAGRSAATSSRPNAASGGSPPGAAVMPGARSPAA